ncbi:hypothetical protein FHR32_007536 [Streptosporangium album]|uniref:Uncharacterized protein n=1 Tax=Streptosporangium album TaxID=47479 RepID=A0A7W7S554_9ACTN|nr:hypothetical protein [Streptosporangium album]
MQQVPQRAGGVRLAVQHSHLGRAEVESRHVRTSLPRQLHTVIVSFGLCHRDGIQTPMYALVAMLSTTSTYIWCS